VTTLAVAREFFEQALENARAIGDRQTERTIALRIVEVIEMEDFHECRVLAEVAAAGDEERAYARSEGHRTVQRRRRGRSR
jgi:hypothetical protein